MKEGGMIFRAVGSYFRQHWVYYLLYGVFTFLLFVVYGLYGLPWGPAVYVFLLCSVAGAVAAGLDCIHYCRRVYALLVVKRTAAVHLDGLPEAEEMQGQCYQDIIAVQERRCRDSQERLDESIRAANQYYTLWSHQIKTPIAALRLLLQEEQPDTGLMEQEVFKIQQYVEMVLGYQRLEGENADLILQEYPVEALARQAVKRVSLLFIHKKVGLSLGELDWHVVTDEKWVVFILEQLLTNAVKYTPGGGQVALYEAPGQPGVLVVEDNGIGIRAEDLPLVFEWGYTGCNGHRDKQATGVGLNLCRQAARLLGHKLWIESELGKGTRVYLNLMRQKFEVE